VIYQVSKTKELTGFLPDRVNTERNMKVFFRLSRRAKKSPQASLAGRGVMRDMAVRNTYGIYR
jgi:hypothetical protein